MNEDKPMDRMQKAIESIRGTIESLTGNARDTAQTARVRPIQRYRNRGGGPFLQSLRKNLEERPTLLDKMRVFRDRKEK